MSEEYIDDSIQNKQATRQLSSTHTTSKDLRNHSHPTGFLSVMCISKDDYIHHAPTSSRMLNNSMLSIVNNTSPIASCLRNNDVQQHSSPLDI